MPATSWRRSLAQVDFQAQRPVRPGYPLGRQYLRHAQVRSRGRSRCRSDWPAAAAAESAVPSARLPPGVARGPRSPPSSSLRGAVLPRAGSVTAPHESVARSAVRQWLTYLRGPALSDRTARDRVGSSRTRAGRRWPSPRTASVRRTGRRRWRQARAATRPPSWPGVVAGQGRVDVAPELAECLAQIVGAELDADRAGLNRSSSSKLLRPTARAMSPQLCPRPASARGLGPAARRAVERALLSHQREQQERIDAPAGGLLNDSSRIRRSGRAARAPRVVGRTPTRPAGRGEAPRRLQRDVIGAEARQRHGQHVEPRRIVGEAIAQIVELPGGLISSADRRSAALAATPHRRAALRPAPPRRHR